MIIYLTHLKWVKNNNFLGVAFDVIEKGKNNKLIPVNFLGEEVFSPVLSDLHELRGDQSFR